MENNKQNEKNCILFCIPVYFLYFFRHKIWFTFFLSLFSSSKCSYYKKKTLLIKVFLNFALYRNKDVDKCDIIDDIKTEMATKKSSERISSKKTIDSPNDSINENSEGGSGGSNWWGSWINTAKSKVTFSFFTFLLHCCCKYMLTHFFRIFSRYLY